MLAVEAGLATLILSDPILSEFREKLTGKFRVSNSDVDQIVRQWATRAMLASIAGKSGWVSEDADDDKFIETAIVGGAAIIVSGDHHLLGLGSVQGIEILTARQFLDRLAVAEPAL
jgi:predicted nucleic acid-binding protein